MDIIISGNKGLIGSALEKRLVEEGHRILLGIDSKNKFDIQNLGTYKLNGKADLFIHAAAHCKIKESIENPKKTFESNVLGTFKVIEFCKENKIPKIVFFSSSRVLSPEKNTYTASKIWGEELCKSFHGEENGDYIILRPSTVYGPFNDKTERVTHKYILNALRGEDLIINGEPETKTLDFTHVYDFVDGTMLAINNPEWNKSYNISGEQEVLIKDVAKYIIKKTDSRSKIKILEADIAQPQQVRLDNSEIKKLGYSPKFSWQEGLDNTVEWYKKNFKENPEIFN